MSLATSASLPTLLFAAITTVSLAGSGIDVTVDGDTSRRTEEEHIPVDDTAALDDATDNGAIDIGDRTT